MLRKIFILLIIFVAASKYYNKELGRTILTSIEFTDEPDSDEIKDYDLDILAPCS